MNIDCSQLIPEAQRPAVEAATACLEFAGDRVAAIVAVGSAVKGGFIPGWSDIDLHLYLYDDAFEGGALRMPLALSIQRGLAAIDPRPFHFISCMPVHASDPGDAPPLVRGGYALLAGPLPRAEATGADLRAQARQALASLHAQPRYVAIGLLEHGGGRLNLLVRRLSGEVWRSYFHLLALALDDPIAAWAQSKPAAVDALPDETLVGQEMRGFYRALTTYQPAGRDSLEAALDVIEQALLALRAIELENRPLLS